MKIFLSSIVFYSGFVISYILNGFLTKNLDLDGYGDIQVALSVASIAAALFIFGGQAASRRFIPLYLKNKEYSRTKGFIHHYLKLAFVIGFCVAILSILIAIIFKNLGWENLEHEAFFAISIAPLIRASAFFGSILQSMQKTISASLPNSILRPLIFLGFTYLWLEFFTKISKYNVISILFVVFIIVIAVQMFLIRKNLPFSWSKTTHDLDVKKWHDVSTPLLYSALVNSFLIRIDLLALEIFHTDERAVGIFSLLLFIASLVWLNFSAISNVISPKISTLKNDKKATQLLYNKLLIFTISANIITASLIIIFSDTILGWFHSDMHVYKDWLYAVVIGAVINISAEVSSPFIRFGGLQKEQHRLVLKNLLYVFYILTKMLSKLRRDFGNLKL